MRKPFRLYWFHQPMCAACAMAEPELLKFMQRHPEGLIVKINMRTHRDPVAGFKATRTPSYLLIPVEESEGVTHEGPLQADDLDDLLHEAIDEPDDEDESAGGDDGEE